MRAAPSAWVTQARYREMQGDIGRYREMSAWVTQASVKLNASLYLPHISLRLPTSPYISLTLTRLVSS